MKLKLTLVSSAIVFLTAVLLVPSSKAFPSEEGQEFTLEGSNKDISINNLTTHNERNLTSEIRSSDRGLGNEEQNEFSNNLLTQVFPLDPKEAEESARIEEEELEEEIAQAEKELSEIVQAEKAADLVDALQKTTDEDDAPTELQIRAKAVQNLMQIFGIPGSLMREETPGPAPEFMIDLYNTITDSSGVTRAKNPYNAHVVRSFIERDSSLNDFFYFNISSLEATESVLEVELHMYRMPTPHHQLHPSLYLTPFYILSLYQVTDPKNLNIPDLHKLLGVHYVPALGSGWEVFNVKKAVLEWLNGDNENHGFLVAATSLGGERVPVRFSRRGETVHSKQPILVLFNHDSHMANVIHHQQQQHSNSNNDRKKIRKKKPDATSIDTAAGGGTAGDNDPNADYTYETTTPLSSLENPRFHHSLLFQDSIRHPNSVSRFRSRRSKNETEPYLMNNNETSNSISHHNYTECGLHDLFVSFEAIGWSSWIISPKGYNAHYCDGPCVFPLGTKVRPTNHATVQSIINELNLNPGLSRPCCVPTTLLPISLLYYDDQDNVVLKQYVDMVAESCGCH